MTTGHSTTTGHDTTTDLPGDERPSITELLSDVGSNLSELMHQELELAKAELRQSATRVGKGAGMLGGAGVAANLMLVFASVAVWWAIGDATGRAWAALIVAGIWAVVALVLAMVGRGEIKSATGMPRTTETVKKIPDALQGHAAPDPTIDLTTAGTPAAARTSSAAPTGTAYPTTPARPGTTPGTPNQEDLR
ncbi:MAG TPA: phage holin family protein [Actinomycetales bacterium]|nr:phage holin family protein [Actinomycetales bacterium]